MKIFVDADALPRMIKDIIIRAADRCENQTIFVANQSCLLPQSQFLSSVVVSAGFDEADDVITAGVSQGDLVITSDIPLAYRVISKGALVITPRGERLTEENISQRLAIRDMMDQLRTFNEEIGGGPAPFKEKDRSAFAREFDRVVMKSKC